MSLSVVLDYRHFTMDKNLSISYFLLNKVITSTFLFNKKKFYCQTRMFIYIVFFFTLDYFIQYNKLSSYITIKITLKNQTLRKKKISEIYISEEKSSFIYYLD
jgi:hypothetical protein